MKICLIEPDTTITIPNKACLSWLFDSKIIPLGEDADPHVLPLYIVHGSTNVDPKHRSIEFDYFRKLSETGHKFGFIHIMDENYNHVLSAYGLNGCQVVFREYVRPNGGRAEFWISYLRSFSLPYPHFKALSVNLGIVLRHLKYRFINVPQFLKKQYLPELPNKIIRHIPLGYTDAISEYSGLSTPSIDKRNFIWSFCGDTFKSDRQKMLTSLSSIKPHYSNVYQGFMGAGSLSGRDYWEVLLNSIYSPCPMGNVNMDSYRLFESLEAGAIPIVIQSHAEQPYNYYHELLGDHPIPTFSHWGQAKNFICRTSTSEITLLSQRITNWYESYKREVRTSIKDVLTPIANRL